MRLRPPAGTPVPLVATEQWCDEGDDLGAFVADWCEVTGDENTVTPRTVVYDAYVAWASEQGITQPRSNRRFYGPLENVGQRQGFRMQSVGNVRAVVGLRLTTGAADAAERLARARRNASGGSR